MLHNNRRWGVSLAAVSKLLTAMFLVTYVNNFERNSDEKM